MDIRTATTPFTEPAQNVFIATVIDRNFVELAGVMVRSLVENGNIGEAKVVVVGDRLRPVDKSNLKKAAHPFEVMILDIPDSMVSQINGLPTNSNWSRTIYARLLLPRLLEEEASRILYVDADTLILNDLQPLLKIDMCGHPVAARGGIDPKTSARLNLPPDTCALNSGVLLFDVKLWQEQGISEACFEVAKSDSYRLKFFDQDMLNVVLLGNFLHLDEPWNDFGYGDLSKTGILHFIHEKPNSVRCKHPARHLYLKYRNATPWANKPLQSIWHKRFKRIKFSIRRKLGLA